MPRLSQLGILVACAALPASVHGAVTIGDANHVVSVASSPDGSGYVVAERGPTAADPDDARSGFAATCRWDGSRPVWSTSELDATRGVGLLAASRTGHRVVSGWPARQPTLTFISSSGVATPLPASVPVGGHREAAISDAGAAVVAWTDENTLRVAAFDGAGWVTAEAGNGPFASLRVAIARDGTAVVTGTTGQGAASVFGWQFSPQRGWEARPHVFARHPLPSSVTPDAAVRVSGAASVAWTGNDGRVVIGNRGTDGRWAGPQVIATERPRTVVRTAVAFDPSGRALVAWTRNRDRRVVTRTRLASFRWMPRAEFAASRASAFEVDFSLGVNARGTAAVMAVIQQLRSPSTGSPFERTLTGLVARPGRAYLPTSTTVVQPARDLMSVLRGPVSVSDANTFVTAWDDLSGSNASSVLRVACGRVPLK